MKTLNFTDRISYLAWRKEWKMAYANLSLNIRQTKPKFKELQRRIEFRVMNEGKYQWIDPYFDGKPLDYRSEHHTVLYELDRMRRHANEMLELLVMAKDKSREQRAEDKYVHESIRTVGDLPQATETTSVGC